jgi:hypothetical protein
MNVLILVYFLILLVFAGYSAIGIYHLWRFGYVGDLTRPVIFIYVIISVSIIIYSFVLLTI